ncbi:MULTISPECIES: co-chaperone GroES [unclassified Gemella]|uniref:co-chaperone GroES n=1 Tax=unclassified Gemella TaxID=2624949 RepID=UPI0015CF8EFC|nr:MULTISPECIES: co-chaperone GroES [unclassified Gemella]MBF0710212.1 co-chaperone GroES [Gemella sp. GL1.1]NYS27556.1 co-chaperone GroES [Gemella sp. GL1]
MIKPVFDNVIIKKIEEEKSTTSGIVLNTKEDTANVGKIYAIGEASVLSVENGGELKEGVQVIFSDKYTKINYKGEDYYIVHEEELLAILG